MMFVTIVVCTWFTGRRITSPALSFATALRPPAAGSIWDRLGMWTAVAILLVALAYGYPLAQLLAHPRYGSPGFQPF
jgi:hypothetical protein